MGRVQELEQLLEENVSNAQKAVRSLESRVGASEQELGRLNETKLRLQDEVTSARQSEKNLVNRHAAISHDDD